jgi:hypothetical protein
MFAAEAAVEPDDRDTWARALARASSLAARAVWVVVIRVLVVCTECAEPWNHAVPVVSIRRRSLSAALKCRLNTDQSFALGSIWRHSQQAISNRPVCSILLYAHRRIVGLVGASCPVVVKETPFSSCRNQASMAVGGFHWSCIRAVFNSNYFSEMLPEVVWR